MEEGGQGGEDGGRCGRWQEQGGGGGGQLWLLDAVRPSSSFFFFFFLSMHGFQLRLDPLARVGLYQPGVPSLFDMVRVVG